MEGSWQGLLVTYEAWLFYFHKVCWKRFCGHGHKEYTEQICDLAQESVTWQWQGHMQFEKAYSTRQDDFIFSEKNPSSSVESGPGGQGMEKKKSLAGELWICF